MIYERIELPQPAQHPDWKSWADRLVTLLADHDERFGSSYQAALDQLAADIAGVGIADGDYGDLIVSNGGATWKLDPSLIDRYVLGLQLAWVSVSTISVGLGRARNGVIVDCAAAWTKSLNSVWAAGNGSGMLDTGAKAISSTYHVHALRKDSDGTFDFLASLSITAPTMPAGYTRVERIGSILTDAAGNIRAFRHYGNEMRIVSVSAGSGTAARPTALIALEVPTGLRVKAYVVATIVGTGGSVLISAAGEDATMEVQQESTEASGQTRGSFYEWTNTTRQIYFGATGTPSAWSCNTIGWIDSNIPRIA